MARQGARRSAVLVVEDEQYQRRHERVAGIDVAKASAVVCTRRPARAGSGRPASSRTVPAIQCRAALPLPVVIPRIYDNSKKHEVQNYG